MTPSARFPLPAPYSYGTSKVTTRDRLVCKIKLAGKNNSSMKAGALSWKTDPGVLS